MQEVFMCKFNSFAGFYNLLFPVPIPMIFWTIHLARKIIFFYFELGPKLSYLVQTYKKIFSDFLGAPQTFLPDYKEALVLTPSAAFFYISWKKKGGS